MPTIQLRSAKVHYSDVGQGKVVLLLHANPGDSEDYAAIIPTIATHRRVIALDWPGYGKSPLPLKPESLDIRFYYNVFIEFIAALNLDRITIIGNSIGGHIAAKFAASFPDKVSALILVAPGGFTPHNFLTRSFCKLQGSQFSLSPYRWERLYLHRRTEVTEKMLERAKAIYSEPSRLAMNRALWKSFAEPESDLREVARAIRTHVLMIFGEKDPAISAKKDAREAAKSIENATICVMPCGHAPFAELPEQFLKKIEQILTL